MLNEEYIRLNREKDVRSLALGKTPGGVDLLWCLRQIEGWQLARKKLPRWAATEGLWFPPRLSMEQCSSEATAEYKRGIIGRLAGGHQYSLTDITGGFGVDFSYMARDAARCVYIERQELLCDAARHNMPLLGIGKAEIVNAEAEGYIADHSPHPTLEAEDMPVRIVFADPARRDSTGRKTVAIEDCTPDICALQRDILRSADYLMVKLSPMLDITQALRSLHGVVEVHAVSVRGECKELIFVLAATQAATLKGNSYAPPAQLAFHCANLESPDAAFTCTAEENRQAKAAMQHAMPVAGMSLFEPNASILKAGVQEAFARRYGLAKLHPQSNLYTSAETLATNPALAGIPARSFTITGLCDFSKAGLKALLKGTAQANLTVRNFPATVADLRRRLKLKEGGSTYLFATTLHDGTHALIRCEKL